MTPFFLRDLKHFITDSNGLKEIIRLHLEEESEEIVGLRHWIHAYVIRTIIDDVIVIPVDPNGSAFFFSASSVAALMRCAINQGIPCPEEEVLNHFLEIGLDTVRPDVVLH